MLGVGVFFTLSGYLITDLLLDSLAAARRPPPGPLLAAPRAPPAPGPVPDARRRQPVGGALRLVAALGRAPAGVGGGAVRQQLVDDRAERLLLRPLRPTAAARPPVVARDRGAVLHRLAVPAAGADLVRPQPQEDGARHARAWPARRRWRWACVYQRGYDPTRVVRRHGHARLRAPDRVRAGHGVADAVGDREPRPVRVEGAGRDRARRAARSLRAGLRGRARSRRSSTRGGSCSSRSRPPRSSPRWSVPPAGSAPRSAGDRSAGSASAPTGSTSGTGRSSSSCFRGRTRSTPRGRPCGRPHVRDLGAVVEVRRGADPPGRARPALEGSARRRGAARRTPPRARAVGRGRGGAPRVRARAERDAAGGLRG